MFNPQLALVGRPKRVILGRGVPRIDTSRLPRGTISVYAPYAVGPNFGLFDLLGNGPYLTPGGISGTASGNLGILTPEGLAAGPNPGSSNNQGYCGVMSAQYKSLFNGNQCSLYFRGYGPFVSANNPTVFGMDYDGPGNSPYVVYQVGIDTTSGAWGCSWNSGGSFSILEDASSSASGASGFTTLVGTYRVGGNVNFYKNGKLINSGAFGASAPAFTSTSDIAFMGFDRFSTSTYTGGKGLMALVSNVEWSATEMRAISPYDFLIYPEDELYAEMVGIGSAPTIQPPIIIGGGVGAGGIIG